MGRFNLVQANGVKVTIEVTYLYKTLIGYCVNGRMALLSPPRK